MPNPENFTPHRTIRVPDDTWNAYVNALDGRNRTDDLKEYMRWRIEHPGVDLSKAPTAVRHYFRVIVTVDGERRTVEVEPEPASGGKTARELRSEIIKAITSWFKRPNAG